MTQLRAQRVTASAGPGWRFTVIFVTGVILVPVLLSILSNSWSVPDDAAYIRMAFATVAGQTIAVVTVVGLLIAMVVRRAAPLVVGVWVVLSVTVLSTAVSSIAGASDLLLQRIELGG